MYNFCSKLTWYGCDLYLGAAKNKRLKMTAVPSFSLLRSTSEITSNQYKELASEDSDTDPLAESGK